MPGPRTTAKRSYRKRVAKSPCKGLKATQCRESKSCKLAVGKKRSFCRKTKNQRRALSKKRVMKKKPAMKKKSSSKRKSSSYKTLSARSSSGSWLTLNTLEGRSSYKTPRSRSSSKKRSTRKINKRVNSLYKKIRANH